MKSIIYICPTGKNKPSGGIKLIYRQAEILSKLLPKEKDCKIFHFEDLNYSISSGNLIYLDKIINQLYLEGINPIALLRATSRHFQKILFINEKIKNGLNMMID